MLLLLLLSSSSSPSPSLMLLLLLELSVDLSLCVNKINRTEQYYQHIQKQFISIAMFYFNNFIISHDFYM
jgi:hypothetical protein